MIPTCPGPREPTRPKFPPPPMACDAHAHVFGPADTFPYATDRSYTPPDAPLAKYLGMLDTLGFDRGVLVQASAHGRDNSAMLDALKRQPDRLRGVAVAEAEVAPAELRRWHAAGVRGLRFNHFFRDGALHYRGGVPLSAAPALAPVMAELGWHLQLWIDVKDLPDTISVLKAARPAGGDRPYGPHRRARRHGEPRFSGAASPCRRWRMLGESVRRASAEPSRAGLRGRKAVPRGARASQSGSARLGQRLAASAHRGRDAGCRTPARLVPGLDAR